MKKPMNIKEFAALAGVSTATVSRVFSNDSKVKAITAEKIKQLAMKHGFRPNTVAQSSFGAKTKSVGVLLWNLRTSYFADIAQGIQAYLLPKGYLPIIISARSFARDYIALRRLVDHRVDGIIACVGEQAFSREEMQEIERFDLPVVSVDVGENVLWQETVSSDEVEIGRLVADHLVRLGHRNIFFYVENEAALSAYPRFVACRKRLREHGVFVGPEQYLSVAVDSGTSAMIDFLRRQNRPVACYAYNDNCAATLYRAAREMGWRIPDDVSVVGTADLNFASLLTPPLTTVRQNGQETGRIASEQLLGMIHENKSYGHVTLPVELVERGSVLRLKGEGV